MTLFASFILYLKVLAGLTAVASAFLIWANWRIERRNKREAGQ